MGTVFVHLCVAPVIARQPDREPDLEPIDRAKVGRQIELTKAPGKPAIAGVVVRVAMVRNLATVCSRPRRSRDSADSRERAGRRSCPVPLLVPRQFRFREILRV